MQKTQKMMMCYIYEYFNGSHAKIYNEILTNSTQFEFDFKNSTPYKAKKFLTEWVEKNKISLNNYWFFDGKEYKEDSNGVPIFVEKNV